MGWLVGFPWVCIGVCGVWYGEADSVVPDSMASRLVHDSGYVFFLSL